MTQPQGTDIVVAALRAALDQQSDAVRAGQLRLELEGALGPEQSRVLRREVHQVVAAAEEHLPTRLARVSPLTASALARLSAELATARGWTPETAERTTRTWAAALGFTDLAAQEWPAARASRSRPGASIDPGLGVTARPPQSPSSTSSPQSPQPSQPGLDPEPADGAGPAWPTPVKRLGGAHAQTEDGQRVLAVVQAYAGVSLALFTVVVVTLTLALIAVLLLLPGSGWLLALIGVAAATYATRFLQYGALMATEAGIEFVPYDGNMRRARPERRVQAPWREVTVDLSTVSRVSAGARRFQVGPRNRAFAVAVQGAVARGRGESDDVSR